MSFVLLFSHSFTYYEAHKITYRYKDLPASPQVKVSYSTGRQCDSAVCWIAADRFISFAAIVVTVARSGDLPHLCHRARSLARPPAL